MAETIVNEKWLWYILPVDLEKQGGYSGVTIDPQTVTATGCGGKTLNGNGFFVSWHFDCLMMITLQRDDPELIEAFAKVVEYLPFCSYLYQPSGLFTYEWAAGDSKNRFTEIKETTGVAELRLLIPESDLTDDE